MGDEEHEGIVERAMDGYREVGENLENFETHAREAVAHGVVAGAEAFGYAATLGEDSEMGQRALGDAGAALHDADQAGSYGYDAANEAGGAVPDALKEPVE